LEVLTDVSEEPTAFIFRVQLKMEGVPAILSGV